MTKKNEFCIFC